MAEITSPRICSRHLIGTKVGPLTSGIEGKKGCKSNLLWKYLQSQNMRMTKIDYVQGVYACIGGDITEDPRRQTGAKTNKN